MARPALVGKGSFRGLIVKLYLYIDLWLRKVFLAGVHAYQRYLGWLLGGHCRFVPSCSCYAEEALYRGPFWKAILLTIWRILRCQPLCKGGPDPVPENMGRGNLPISSTPPQPPTPNS